MRTIITALAMSACTACGGIRAPALDAGRSAAPDADSYLFVWAGDSAGTAGDFLAVIDASPASSRYGEVVASLPTEAAGAHPHHTEPEMPASGRLLANGFGAGRTWLFDLTAPRAPTIAASFDDLAGFSHPHSFVRLPGGQVLATFQYARDTAAAPAAHVHGGAAGAPERATGGLVVMDERGTVIRSGRAADSAIADRRIFPYSAVAVPSLDRIVSTTTDMNGANRLATGEWVQFWRLSDLTMLRSIALAPGPRGDEHRFTGEPRLLPDGKSVYVHTFNCGLYLIRDIGADQPRATFVRSFQGGDCGVPVLTGRYWLQTVPHARALVALDISDPEHPREAGSITLGDDEQPHWIAIDGTGRRIVLNSGGGTRGNRLFVIDFDPATGALTLDERFRDARSSRAGISFTGRAWPHGFIGTAHPHGSVFSR